MLRVTSPGPVLARAIAAALLVTLQTRAARAGDPLIAPAQQAAQQPPSGQPTSGQPTSPPPAPPAYPVHPWEMAPIDVTVSGERSALREEQRIGAYKQPRWTAKRRFPTTRVYVVPAGKMEIEWWFRYTAPFDKPSKEREIRTQWEIEMGLGHHLQVDLYLVGQQLGQGQFAITREKAEVRWAWSPVRPANLLFVPLFGAGVEDGKVRGIFQAWIISGWTY